MWFYRKISQTSRSENAPPKHNSPASDKKLCVPRSHNAPTGPYLAVGAGVDLSILISGDRNARALLCMCGGFSASNTAGMMFHLVYDNVCLQYRQCFSCVYNVCLKHDNVYLQCDNVCLVYDPLCMPLHFLCQYQEST